MSVPMEVDLTDEDFFCGVSSMENGDPSALITDQKCAAILKSLLDVPREDKVVLTSCLPKVFVARSVDFQATMVASPIATSESDVRIGLCPAFEVHSCDEVIVQKMIDPLCHTYDTRRTGNERRSCITNEIEYPIMNEAMDVDEVLHSDEKNYSIISDPASVMNWMIDIWEHFDADARHLLRLSLINYYAGIVDDHYRVYCKTGFLGCLRRAYAALWLMDQISCDGWRVYRVTDIQGAEILIQRDDIQGAVTHLSEYNFCRFDTTNVRYSVKSDQVKSWIKVQSSSLRHTFFIWIDSEEERTMQNHTHQWLTQCLQLWAFEKHMELSPMNLDDHHQRSQFIVLTALRLDRSLSIEGSVAWDICSWFDYVLSLVKSLAADDPVFEHLNTLSEIVEGMLQREDKYSAAYSQRLRDKCFSLGNKELWRGLRDHTPDLELDDDVVFYPDGRAQAGISLEKRQTEPIILDIGQYLTVGDGREIDITVRDGQFARFRRENSESRIYVRFGRRPWTRVQFDLSTQLSSAHFGTFKLYNCTANPLYIIVEQCVISDEDLKTEDVILDDYKQSLACIYAIQKLFNCVYYEWLKSFLQGVGVSKIGQRACERSESTVGVALVPYRIVPFAFEDPSWIGSMFEVIDRKHHFLSEDSVRKRVKRNRRNRIQLMTEKESDLESSSSY